MQTWKWLYNPESPFNWRFLANALIRAAIMFVAVNLIFALTTPIPSLAQLSAYNLLLPGRERLPYGEVSNRAYNLSLFSVEGMFESLELDAADDDGYRVLLVGDSSIWGILLEPGDTLAGRINAGGYVTSSGERVRVYNLGYPTMSLTKDLMLLDYAMRYDPDLIVWSLTLESFPQQEQLDSPIASNNPDRVKPLIEQYHLNQDANDARFVKRDGLWEETIIKRRRALADLLRLQIYGIAWAVTDIDQYYPDEYTPRAIDLTNDLTWKGYTERAFTEDELAFDTLRAGLEIAGDTPVLLVNEPIFISAGNNSDRRYNAWYPIWAYDDYRRTLLDLAAQQGWQLLDLWDTLPDADCYTDSPVHLTPTCSAQLAQIVGPAIVQMAATGSVTPDRE